MEARPLALHRGGPSDTGLALTGYFVGQLTREDAVAETKLLGLAPLFLGKFQSMMATFRDENRRVYARILGSGALFGGVTTLAFFATFIRVALRAAAGEVSFGQLAIYGGATGRLRVALDQTIQGLTHALEHTLHIGTLRELPGPAPRSGAGGDGDVLGAAWRGRGPRPLLYIYRRRGAHARGGIRSWWSRVRPSPSWVRTVRANPRS